MNLTVWIKKNPQKLKFSFVDNVIMETVKLILDWKIREIKIRRKTKRKTFILILLNPIQLMKLVAKEVFYQLKTDR